jgi:hypothetical protein
MLVTKPAECEMRSVIPFLKAKNFLAAEIQGRLLEMCEKCGHEQGECA